MKIKVEFVGAIDTGSHAQIETFNVKKGETIESFLSSLHFHQSHIKFIQVVKNGKKASHYDELSTGDSLELMLMVGGG